MMLPRLCCLCNQLLLQCARVSYYAQSFCRYSRCRVTTKNPHVCGQCLEFLESCSDFFVLQRSAEIQIEVVLPRLASNRATFDFEQINRPPRKGSQGTVQRARSMPEPHHQRHFVRRGTVSVHRIEQHEPREVLSVIFKAGTQDGGAINLGGAPSCDS